MAAMLQSGNHPKVVFVDDENKIARVTNYEKHGKLTEDFI